MTSTYDQKVAWLDSLPRGARIGGTTPGGVHVVGVKIGDTQSHGLTVWTFSNGRNIPGSDAPAAMTDLVHLVPEPGEPWAPETRAARALKPEDFYTRYDEHHIFSFFEVEDGGRFYTFGHVKFSDWGEEIHRYLAESDADSWPYEGIDETAMSHVWVVGTAYPYAPEEIAIQEVPEGTPGAVPASVYAP